MKSPNSYDPYRDRDLDLAESTVASHIKSIYRKLGISSRAEAAWHATRMGLSTAR